MGWPGSPKIRSRYCITRHSPASAWRFNCLGAAFHLPQPGVQRRSARRVTCLGPAFSCMGRHSAEIGAAFHLPQPGVQRRSARRFTCLGPAFSGGLRAVQLHQPGVQRSPL
ncbi:hypothetical protein FQA47_007996 [Oryzias melastigma]|uniref:Uncharacterized protein n=1 Tax=Oryzias melastigma TaxID=30732 RepID=A0A834CVR9_ORYME|nr:hypothetical protein FQA47_007996 [Oryzias melastigma]